MGAGELDDKRSELRRRLRQIEDDLTKAQSELVSLGEGERLPGLFLIFEVAGFAAALPVSRVAEIVRLVECSPLPKAPPHVLGTFVYRGDPIVTVDLAVYLGTTKGEPRLDAHVVVIDGTRRVALVVDRVRSMIEAPAIAAGDGSEASPTWFASKLVAGLVRSGDELVPLINVDPLLEGVEA
jgi:purine-binding chemotaxis protein CheW